MASRIGLKNAIRYAMDAAKLSPLSWVGIAEGVSVRYTGEGVTATVPAPVRKVRIVQCPQCRHSFTPGRKPAA